MKILTTIYLILFIGLILFFGCAEPVFDGCLNNNITVNNTIIKTVVMNCTNKTFIRTKIIVNASCGAKLDLCSSRIDSLNKYLFECLTLNETRNHENMTDTLKKCQIEKKELNDKLKNISRLI